VAISQHYFTFPIYIPRILALFKNWYLYLFNYLLRRQEPAEYNLRNGYRLIDGAGSLAGTIAVVFVRQEYGRMSNVHTILDIGANMGSFMMYAAMVCPTAKIYCYEPVEQNYSILKKNIAINSLENRVNASQCAVAARSGKMKINLISSPLHSFFAEGSENDRQEIACVTLREIFECHKLEKVDFVKMNCEGAEYEILENCSPSDFDRIPNIRLEYHNLDSANKNGNALARFLEGKGYRITRFTRYQGTSGFIWASHK
jgi:FkbM family methyltransferase